MKFSIFNFQFSISEKGVSIYLALMIMFILIAIGLGISLIIVSQMKMIRGMGDSVVAFYAADTGIEHSLYNNRKEGGTGAVSGSVGGAGYSVSEIVVGETWRSVGSYPAISPKVKRAIEIITPIPPPPAFDYKITLDPTSATWPARCPVNATVTTELVQGDDRPITFYGTGPAAVSFLFNPLGCDSVNCSSIVTIKASTDGVYILNICGHTDILDKCAQFTYTATPNPGGTCPD